MNNNAIVVAFHKYTPFGDKFYDPIYKYFIGNLFRNQDEFNTLYLIDSNWGIKEYPSFTKVIKVNPSLRYYDAYKQVLPQIEEDNVLFLDNDVVIYKPLKIAETFSLLGKYDVVSIYDTIGTYKTDKLNGKNKFCPYWFASPKELLMKYLDCDWGSNMPEHETLGKLTERMLKDGIKPYEFEEDKSNFLFGEKLEDKKSYDLGYYHIRAGSTPAVLLSWRDSIQHKQTYLDHIKGQPKSEYLRQFAWYWIMGGSIHMDMNLFKEIGVDYPSWLIYVENFRKFHGLV